MDGDTMKKIKIAIILVLGLSLNHQVLLAEDLHKLSKDGIAKVRQESDINDILGEVSPEDSKIIRKYLQDLASSELKISQTAVAFFFDNEAYHLAAGALNSKNIDARISVLKKINKLDQEQIGLLISALEVNLKDQPLFVSGSENATIQSIYITELINALGKGKGISFSEGLSLNEKVSMVLK